MAYKVYTNSFITKERLENDDLIKIYLNDEKISQTEDTFEFESETLEEARKEFESLITKPKWDCYHKGYQYVIVILTDEIEILEIEARGFEYDNALNDMLAFEFEDITTNELKNILSWYEKNKDKLVGNFDIEIEDIKEMLGA